MIASIMDDTTTTAPMPSSARWFMPWRWLSHWALWKRWTLFVVVMLAGYIETPVVVDPLFSQTSSPLIDALGPYFEIVYFLIGYGYEHSSAVRWFYDQQFAIVETLFRRFDR
jgi:hypothetical protein